MDYQLLNMHFNYVKPKHFRGLAAACNTASSNCAVVMWGRLIIRSPTLDKLWFEKVNAVIEMLIINLARKDVKFRRYLKETRSRDIIVMVKGEWELQVTLLEMIMDNYS